MKAGGSCGSPFRRISHVGTCESSYSLLRNNQILKEKILWARPDPTDDHRVINQWWRQINKGPRKTPLPFCTALVALKHDNRPRCFMDLCLDDGEFLGRLIFELNAEICPKTSLNFIKICNGTHECGLRYKGTTIHRISTGVCLEGGITKSTMFNYSIRNQMRTNDAENYTLKHDCPGVLSMDGRADSQFLVTLTALPELDGRKVAFGRLVCGLHVLRSLDRELSSARGRPKKRVRIRRCGQLYGHPCTACKVLEREECLANKLDHKYQVEMRKREKKYDKQQMEWQHHQHQQQYNQCKDK